MSVVLKKTVPSAAIRLVVTDAVGWPALAKGLDAATRTWLQTLGFKAAEHTHAIVPNGSGGIALVFVGVGRADHPFALSSLPLSLPEGEYTVDAQSVPPEQAASSWLLGAYEFTRYRPVRRAAASLVLAQSESAQRGIDLARTLCQVRDWVNTPAEHMGPADLAAAAQAVAKAHGARFKQVVGDDLQKAGFPAVHAVGRASTRPPCLIELNWGLAKHPRLALVGKGVCFDTGGLDIKSAEGMRQMKKDMGGAANVLGLASLIMARKLPVRLQVLIPAVENSVAGNAYRPGDVIKTRNGTHIEIGNTDAEGRVILCDALSYAVEGKPALIIDMATLTGAARVALGPQVAALFTRNTAMARELQDLGIAMEDPMWHMPLWRPYKGGIESAIADLVNTGQGPQGGAINAALFLDHFIPAGQEWLHLDMHASNEKPRAGRPVGGEAQTVRTLLAYLQARFGA